MIDTKYFKQKLEEELATIENDLTTVGRRAKENGRSGWGPADPDTGKDSAEDGEVAENFVEFENNTAVFDKLLQRETEVKEALRRIDDETYGKCGTCGKEIEIDRLKANPAATTCKEHMAN